jgi:hypothetical protein
MLRSEAERVSVALWLLFTPRRRANSAKAFPGNVASLSIRHFSSAVQLRRRRRSGASSFGDLQHRLKCPLNSWWTLINATDFAGRRRSRRAYRHCARFRTSHYAIFKAHNENTPTRRRAVLRMSSQLTAPQLGSSFPYNFARNSGSSPASYRCEGRKWRCPGLDAGQARAPSFPPTRGHWA